MAHSSISYLLHWGKKQCDVIFIWARDSICCITGLLIILFFYDPCICVCITCVVRFWSLANKGHIQYLMHLPLMIISWKLACHYDHYIYEWGKRLQWHCAIIDEQNFFNILGKCEWVSECVWWLLSGQMLHYFRCHFIPVVPMIHQGLILRVQITTQNMSNSKSDAWKEG